MKPDVIIIGAGAAGLMCARSAGLRGKRVLVLDHANKVGKKILMSGGGRCNFTNLNISPSRFLSANPHFVKSALARYTQWDFIDMVQKHRIPYHEKTQGQLFCDESSKAIVQMLLDEVLAVGVTIEINTKIVSLEKAQDHFTVKTSKGLFKSPIVVIATGGLSIPTMGATPFAYQIAAQFGLKVRPTRAGLVPFTLDTVQKEQFSPLSGISVWSDVKVQDTAFRENILFTHRGMSGPAILQISSYWQTGQAVEINLLPDDSLLRCLVDAKASSPNKKLFTLLATLLPKRLIEVWFDEAILRKNLADLSKANIEYVVQKIHHWSLLPHGTEGYRTAEVTLGGVDCDEVSSKTMQANTVEGLYFIGEALDVAGWLGGYNFQWAWSSGHVAGQSF